ncbi:nicotinamide phosphoribosyltransferase [Chitinivorax tropicus]|uniref:Nicotinamide phosphoribosyltransferase n=1 Tax=Chitinivorax tropicus TaxID=714531 RepID=A0A840MQW0_9PROT|nr:nicotinate phosphoribosyltransferase [Chitinivorax tropicus]MBB5017621.1 nicotinamide phosphoribosyltransferase [Chitinivorax tropicus]
MFDNILLNTDSYKASHFLQYPAGADAMFSYIESRGGAWDKLVFFGLQSILKEYLGKPITHAMVDEAATFFQAHGEPFNAVGFHRIVDELGGFLPIRIKAAPEGLVVPTRQVLATIESTHPDFFWVGSYFEPLLLRVWYPASVATQSYHLKQLIRHYLDISCDNPDGELPFKLHDFGARGVSSTESSALGGMAHLVNFMGSDTVMGVVAAKRYYGVEMAAYSIPAAEHSTITSWGRAGEVAAYQNMLTQFAKPGSLVAVVSDSYDIYHAVEHIWGDTLRQAVVDSGATVVIRPDSGDPATVVLKCAHLLDARFGSTVNGKGYKVLKHVRLIQGDGINPSSVRAILDGLLAAGFSAENVAFGMGGMLLQGLNRDTLKWAMKCSAMRIQGEWVDVYKDPVTDSGKRSKRGRISLFRNQDGEYRSLRVDEVIPEGFDEVLVPVWENGQLLRDFSFDEVRANAV